MNFVACYRLARDRMENIECFLDGLAGTPADAFIDTVIAFDANWNCQEEQF